MVRLSGFQRGTWKLMVRRLDLKFSGIRPPQGVHLCFLARVEGVLTSFYFIKNTTTILSFSWFCTCRLQDHCHDNPNRSSVWSSSVSAAEFVTVFQYSSLRSLFQGSRLSWQSVSLCLPWHSLRRSCKTSSVRKGRRSRIGSCNPWEYSWYKENSLDSRDVSDLWPSDWLEMVPDLTGLLTRSLNLNTVSGYRTIGMGRSNRRFVHSGFGMIKNFLLWTL